MGVISDLIASALVGGNSEAMAKIAQEASVDSCEDCGKAVSAGSKLCKECADKKAKAEMSEYGTTVADSDSPSTDDSKQEKTSSDTSRVLKLANALDFVVTNPHLVDWNQVVKLSQETPGGHLPPTDEGKSPEKMPVVLSGAKTREIPVNPQDSSTTLRNDDKSGAPPRSEPSSGVSGNGGTKLVERLKQAMAKRAESPATNQNVLPEDRPPQIDKPAEVSSQESMIADNTAPAKATPDKIEKEPKKQLGDLLFEPKKSVQQDEAAQQLLGNPPQDVTPAKTASASLISKLASGQCTCGEKGTCGACQIKLAADKRAKPSLSKLLGKS